jgi:purine-binding chemotaxis protein CheW
MTGAGTFKEDTDMAEPALATNQFLTFTLDQDVYAMEIDSIREVLEATTITKIPRTPEFMLGVINLRGHAVPVMDLRMKFSMGEVQQTVETCIIIAEVAHDGATTSIGALVDSVDEVFGIPADSIEPAPRMGSAIEAEFIAGIGRKEEAFVIILDTGKVFSAEELQQAGEAARRAAPGNASAPADEGIASRLQA